MKWGIRRTPEQLGHKNLKNAKTSNLEKWGSDSEHNILYITGHSGSGKSTLAKTLKTKNTDVITLDSYFDEVTDRTAKQRNKQLDSILKKNGVKIPIIKNKSQAGFEKSLDEFGRSQYKKNRKVIVEGIQIADSGLYSNKNYYKDKPVVIIDTSSLKSLQNRLARDSDSINSFNQAKEYATWYFSMSKDLSRLSTITEAKKGRDFVNEFLKGYR